MRSENVRHETDAFCPGWGRLQRPRPYVRGAPYERSVSSTPCVTRTPKACGVVHRSASDEP